MSILNAVVTSTGTCMSPSFSLPLQTAHQTSQNSWTGKMVTYIVWKLSYCTCTYRWCQVGMGHPWKAVSRLHDQEGTGQEGVQWLAFSFDLVSVGTTGCRSKHANNQNKWYHSSSTNSTCQTEVQQISDALGPLFSSNTVPVLNINPKKELVPFYIQLHVISVHDWDKKELV